MRRTLTAILLSLVACVAAFGQSNVEAAREELNEGARLYREGDFASAEQHFRRALELNPDGKNIQLFIARAIQQQYKPGVQSPENIAVGERAVAAYQEIFQKDPANDDAYKAVVFLYGQMKNEDKVREMLFERANNGSVSNEKRAEAFVILASKQWYCSYEVTEQKANKRTVEKRDRFVIVYKMPADVTEFYKAQQCVAEGLQLVEQAIALNQDFVNAWSYKANLLREASKLAEMEGNKAQKADYDRQYEEALATHKRLSEEEAKKRQASALRDKSRKPGSEADLLVPPERLILVAPTPKSEGAPVGVVSDSGVPPPPPRPTSDDDAQQRPRTTIISGGVLNGKAVYKPAPEYPAIAKAARAQGTVTVQILVDEDGNVAEAKAVSGHPLLQQAAVEAARRARFTPTRLEGQPVRVSGVVTYNFVLR